MPGLMPPPAIQTGKQRGMVVAAVVVAGQLALAVDRAAELAAPDDQRVVEQAALLEVGDQGVAGLVDVLALGGQVAGEVAVLVPAAVEDLHEPDVALGQPAGQQAAARRTCPGLWTSGPYMSRMCLRLARDVDQLGDRGLHPEGHLVLGDAGLGLGVGRPRRTACWLSRPRASSMRRRVGGVDARRGWTGTGPGRPWRAGPRPGACWAGSPAPQRRL